jgi:hypothetical protein
LGGWSEPLLGAAYSRSIANWSSIRQARTRELSEALTATSEVLRAICSSPGELEPVFQAMLANATRLCEASYGAMWLKEGDRFRNAAFHDTLPAAYIEQWRSAIVGRTAPMGRVARSRKRFRSLTCEKIRRISTAIH